MKIAGGIAATWVITVAEGGISTLSNVPNTIIVPTNVPPEMLAPGKITGFSITPSLITVLFDERRGLLKVP